MKENHLSRREFLKKAAITGGAVSLSGGLLPLLGCQQDFSTDPDRPNIIMITADDLAWRELSCYGNQELNTPNIDRLAEEGVKFNRCFVVSSSCSPSRASLITGQYPHTNGVTGLTHLHPFSQLSPFHRTLPEMLEDIQFNTCLEGKWHVAPYMPAGWFGYQERLSGLFGEDMWIQNADKTVDFIKQNKNNRFYLEVNYMNNHRKDDGEFYFDPDFPKDPEQVHVPEYYTLPQWPEIKLEIAKYYSQTEKMDHMIGRILDTLDEEGLAENTLVVFVSDNGPPFPGNKMTLYDRGTAVPLLVRWPARFPAKKEVDHLINTIDIMPSILESAGISIPEDIQGKSFYKLATGESDEALRDALFMEMTYHVDYVPTRAIRTDRYKYMRNYSDNAIGLDQNNHMDWAHRLCELPNQPWKSPRPKEELYDLLNDPHEQVNLVEVEEYQSVLLNLKERLDQHMRETNDPYLNQPFTHDYEAENYQKTT